MPLLVLRHGPVSLRHVGALRADPRFEVFVPEAWGDDVLALSQRVAATVVITMGEPLRALTYAVTSGFTGAMAMLISPRFGGDRELLLQAGAVACLTLPVRTPELGALLAKLAPRPHLAHTDPGLRLTLDPVAREVRHRDRCARLSQREFAVLHCLVSHGGNPVDANSLLREVWGAVPVQGRPRQIVDVYVCQLRKKLKRIGLPGAIATIRGFGYALGPDAARQVRGQPSPVNLSARQPAKDVQQLTHPLRFARARNVRL